MVDQFLRIALPIYFVAFFGVAMFWRSYLVWKRTGVIPYVLGKSGSAYDAVGLGFKISLLLNLLAVASFSFFRSLYGYLGPLEWLEIEWVRILGVAMLFIALIFIAIAQAQMGRSWRVGIDEEHETELVRNGFFKHSRNPIFLGMRISGLGLFLAIPNALTFATLIMGDVLIQVQVRLEEDFLERKHGDRYMEFRKKVRRWI